MNDEAGKQGEITLEGSGEGDAETLYTSFATSKSEII